MPASHEHHRLGRNLLISVLSASAVVALVGCSSGPTPSGDSTDAPITLTMAVESQATGSPYAQQAQNYMAEHPNVTINVTEISNETLPQVINTQLQGGNAPDIFYVTGGNGGLISALPLAKAGYLLDLSGTPAEGLLNDSTKRMYELDGKVYGQPLDLGVFANDWNMTAAESVGITPPETYADVLDACAKAKDAGISLYTIAGAAVNNMAMLTVQIAASRVYNETPDWDQQKTDGKVSFADTDGWKETLQTIVDMNEAGCFNPDAVAGQIANNTPNVAAGRALAAFAPSAALSDLNKNNPDNTYALHVFPGVKADDTTVLSSPSNALAINAKSDKAKQDAALDFFAWLAQPENADKTAELSGSLSITAGTGGTLPEAYSALEPLLADSQLLPYILWPNAQVTQDLGTGVQGLLTGQTTVDSVLQQLDADWTK